MSNTFYISTVILFIFFLLSLRSVVPDLLRAMSVTIKQPSPRRGELYCIYNVNCRIFKTEL